MKALKLAGSALAAVIVIAALLLVIGIPSGMLTASITDRVERDTGFRLTIAGSSTIGLWPSLNVTMNDVTLEGPGDRDAGYRLAVGRIQARMTLASAGSGRPEITELAIIRPHLSVPLLRERTAVLKPSSARPAASAPAADADAAPIERVTVSDGTVTFSNLRDRVEHRIEGINANAATGSDRTVGVTGNARTGGHPLTFAIKASVPPLERQSVPLQLTLDAPGMLQAQLTAKAEVRLNGSLVMINGLSGAIGEGAFNGWGSVDLASKPLVKLDLDFRRLDIAAATPTPPGSPDP